MSGFTDEGNDEIEGFKPFESASILSKLEEWKSWQSTPSAKANLWENKPEPIRDPVCPRCGFPEDEGPAECNILGHESDILPGKGHICGLTIIGDDIRYDPSKENGGVKNCFIVGRLNKLIVGQNLMGKRSWLYTELDGRYGC